MTAEARTAGWCRNNAASFNKGFQQAVFHCLEVDRLGCRNDDGTYILGNFFTLENGSSFFHIPIEAVGASEVSDAFIIVVSEETGKISIARDGKLEKAVSEAVFRQELLNLCEKTAPAGAKAINKIWRGMSRHDK